MVKLDIREFESHLREHLNAVRDGEEILVTDNGEVIAELRQPIAVSWKDAPPKLIEYARRGGVRIGGPNRPDLYPRLPRAVPEGMAAKLLDEQRGER